MTNNDFKIVIEDNTISKLAGNEYGKNIFDNQLKNKIDYNNDINIVFPDRIDRIAVSFIQGFFNDIFDEIGIIGLQEKLNISSNVKGLKAKIIDSFNFY